MDFQIGLLLLQDGITNGALYALLAVALVLVFTVTRIIFIPQGEFVTYGALTLATLQAGSPPGTMWLLLAGGILVAVADAITLSRNDRMQRLLGILLKNLAYPAAIIAIVLAYPPDRLPMAAQVALSLAIVIPLGPQIYRLAYQPIASCSVLVLLIASVAVDLAMVGFGLLFFGAEGKRTPAFSDGLREVGPISFTDQALFILACFIALVVALYFFFGRTLIGKALRATAFNQTGARLIGISSRMTGRLSLALAAAIGAISGILAAPITTLYYDTGFLFGLKGFVAAIIGGLGSYPAAAAGAILIGVLESYSAFWASVFKEAIVFTLVIPVLLGRSLFRRSGEADE